MAKIVHGSTDSEVGKLAEALIAYEQEFSGSDASLYRQNPGSIRIRIIDDRFGGMSRSRRHELVWKYLDQRVPEDVMSQVSTLLLIPTSELRSSLGNLEFDDPLPSHL